MAKYGSNSFAISVDNSSGSAVALTSYVTDVSTFEVSANLVESHSMGDAWQESLASGIRSGSELTIGGFYDDTASTGPDAILNAPSSGPAVSTRTVTITWGGSKTTSFEAVIRSYSRTAARNELTRWEAVLVPTGTITEA